jgi:hypothetical protein
MKNKLTIVTKPIKDGKTGFGEAILNALESLEGKRAKISIEEYKRPRSNKQNRYYWGVVLKYYRQFFQANGTFMSNDDMHIWIKEYVWHDYVDITLERVSRDGEVLQIPFRKILTSTRLDTQEWEQRMTLSRQYAVENFNGMQIPEPSETIDEHVKQWLEHADGLYYGADYSNYFDIVKPA